MFVTLQFICIYSAYDYPEEDTPLEIGMFAQLCVLLRALQPSSEVLPQHVSKAFPNNFKHVLKESDVEIV